ncbi:MAG: PHP domain-containing protein [Acidobacteriota bacterium]|nr:PHP domain-containing protein [Acidobacteriota bacterium]
MSPAPVLSSTLDALADLAEIRGAAVEAVDLRSAAAAIGNLGPAAAAALERRTQRNNLSDEPGISTRLHRTLREVTLGGAEAALAAARCGIPMLLRRLLELGVVNSHEAAFLVRELGIVTLSDLQAALDDDRLTRAADRSLGARLRPVVGLLEQESRLVPLGRATDVLETVLAAIERLSPSIDLLTAAGDVRRFEALASSLILVGRASDPARAIELLDAMGAVDGVLHRSARRAILLIQQHEVDVRVAAPDDYGTVLFGATGSRRHVRAVHERRGRPRLAAGESALYAHAGLPFIPPELREGAGEVEAAAAGTLPVLVQREHIRGDLHMHSTYSDGADPLDMMVGQCAALGYEYIAITDHSERAAASRTVSRADLARQRRDIAVLRDRYPGMTILHGLEVDIMPDGRLDFEDAVLESLDIVLASLHDSARQDAKTLTERCIRAIRHPLVTIITHPANRLVGRRAGYALDFDEVFAAAAETGTALEVDGAPSHLDLDGELARRAIAAGVTLAIDSDCHRARALHRQMALGIGTARRGWVEPRHVLNTRPLPEVLAFIKRKRGRRS